MLLSCQVKNGQFSNEYAVIINLPESQLSLFADKFLVETKNEKPYLKVDVLPTDNPQSKRVLLPSETFESGSRWISVPSSALQPA